MRLAAEAAIVVALALVACRSRNDAPSSTTASGSGAIDLLVTPVISLTAELAPTRPFVKELDVWSPSSVSVTMTHASGALGPFTLGIYDARAPNAPLGRDSMTCERANCYLTAEVDVVPGTTRLVVRAEAGAALGVKLDVAAATKAK